jgi:hypothetical protein
MGSQKSNPADYIEKRKEVNRFHFEYFKQLSTLSTASIGAILVLFTKLPLSSGWAILAGLSLLCLVTCLVITLFGMTAPGNLVKKLVDLGAIANEPQQNANKRDEEADKNIEEYIKGMKELGVCDLVTRYTFITGVVLFLSYAVICIIKS